MNETYAITITQGISKVVSGVDLTRDEIRSIIRQIMDGVATPAQIGAFLTGLRMKGETPEEIAGAAEVMREKALKIPVSLKQDEVLVDTCGTGGDGAGTFNVSTTVAFVVAGAGVKVAKHGNRSVSSKSGSADVLEALGVNLSLSPEMVAKAIEDIGIGFLFAPSLHPAMKHAIGPRREIGIRTIFNILGPLTNPAGANVQVLGVYEKELIEPVANVLGILGAKRAWIVHGEGGLDELSLLGTTSVAQWDGTKVTSFTITPKDAGLSPCRPEELSGGTPEENALIVREILSGKKGPKTDMVLLNAAAALYLAGRGKDLLEAIEVAKNAIESGAALEKLESLISLGKS